MSKTRIWYVSRKFEDGKLVVYVSDTLSVLADKIKPYFAKIQKFRTISYNAAARKYIKHTLPRESVLADKEAGDLDHLEWIASNQQYHHDKKGKIQPGGTTAKALIQKEKERLIRNCEIRKI